MAVEYLRPSYELIQVIADNMRQSDIEEIWLSDHVLPFQALEKGMLDSDYSVIISINGEPCVMIGLVLRNVLTDSGVIWMLGAECSLKYRRYFITEVPKILRDMFKVCSNLYNYVYEGNRETIAWLTRLGFILEDAQPYGVERANFHRFYMEKN